jgi:hypothetical protein
VLDDLVEQATAFLAARSPSGGIKRQGASG